MDEDELRPRVMLGRPGSDHLAIEVLARLHPGADGYWDGNWLATPIEAKIGSFRASVGAGLRSDELLAFRDDVRRLYDTLSGHAELNSMEDWLSVRLTVGSGGQVVVSGHLRDRLGSRNVLTFEFGELDQSDLVAVIDGLDEVQVFFPVIGSPD